MLDAIEDNNTLKKKVEDLEDQMKEITCPMHQEQLILGCGQCETLICEECLPEHKDHQLCKKENVCQLILDKAKDATKLKEFKEKSTKMQVLLKQSYRQL